MRWKSCQPRKTFKGLRAKGSHGKEKRPHPAGEIHLSIHHPQYPDYFIHKDLGAFLKRELDFYIKNEIMRLTTSKKPMLPKLRTTLPRSALRKIACKLIEFMAQLEDFQKKLWLKKKFVVETNYCITLDRVPEELYPEIIANQAQHDEWVKLFAIDEIEGDAVCPAYTEPLTLNFLKANDKLVLDTRFFTDCFKARLLSSIEDFDEQCDGL